MNVTKKSFSVKEIQRQLGLKRCEPVLAMVHKLRKAMGNRDAKYTLEAIIEFDEAYFTVESSEVEKQKRHSMKRSCAKQNVAVNSVGKKLYRFLKVSTRKVLS